MIRDAQLMPSDAQPMAGAAGTVAPTNSIDLLSENRNLGRGQPMRAVVTVDVTCTGGISIQPRLIESDNADLSGATVIATGPVVAEADLTAGEKIWDTALPDNSKRFIGFQYVKAGTHTAGALTAAIVSDSDNQPYLPANTGF